MELMSIIAIITVAGLIVLPAMDGTKEGRRARICRGNLKLFGMVSRMYAEEHNGHLPKRSPIPNHWVINAAMLYPDYVDDFFLLRCPFDPRGRDQSNTHLWNPSHGLEVLSCLDTVSYTYTGFVAMNETELGNVVRAFDEGKQDRDSLSPLVFDSSDPKAAEIPIMWDLVPYGVEKTADMWHKPGGGHVLYLDGHAEFKQLSDDTFPISPAVGELLGGLQPIPPEVCLGES
jgi:prepilin-type processing-associated H-X9-DG protein